MIRARLLRRERRASTLVVVLVVLAIVGVMTTQAFQSLIVVRRSHRQRTNLRQAREVVSFVRRCLAAEPRGAKTASKKSFRIEVREGEMADVQVMHRLFSGGRDRASRIEVHYPIVDSTSASSAVAQAWTVSWQSDDWEASLASGDNLKDDSVLDDKPTQ